MKNLAIKMKWLILCFSLYASKPAVLDDIDHMELEEVKPSNTLINGDMNFGYLKEILKPASINFHSH